MPGMGSMADLLRLVILVAAMIPDTIVGIVLLQTNTGAVPGHAGHAPVLGTRTALRHPYR